MAHTYIDLYSRNNILHTMQINCNELQDKEFVVAADQYLGSKETDQAQDYMCNKT
jgi:hypothetical protein